MAEATFAGMGIGVVTDLAVRWRVERERSAARAQREQLLADTVTRPLAAWLEARPLAGGTSTERLQAILHRVPAAVRALAAAVAKP